MPSNQSSASGSFSECFSRHEQSLEASTPEPITRSQSESDPEHEALPAESVGLALLVMLDTLPPAERVVLVLHDIFAGPFDKIAHVVERASIVARQLGSRARRLVRGRSRAQDANRTEQRGVVEAFLSAARVGNFDALLAVLDPGVVFRHDCTAVPLGASREVHGALAVAKQFAGRAQAARPILVNGAARVMIAPVGSGCSCSISRSRTARSP
jgi:RNA polymerase sigma-70 factor (ECF subfamily)